MAACQAATPETLLEAIADPSPTPIQTATPTRSSTATPSATPTETPQPTPTATSTATATPTLDPTAQAQAALEELLAQAPVLEGLAASLEDGRVVYHAVEGNPYGMAAGAYAGYLFEFEDKAGDLSDNGIDLEKQVRRALLDKANNPEAIKEGKWKTTMPLEPQAERIIVSYHTHNLVQHANLANFRGDNIIRSPFYNTQAATMIM